MIAVKLKWRLLFAHVLVEKLGFGRCCRQHLKGILPSGSSSLRFLIAAWKMLGRDDEMKIHMLLISTITIVTFSARITTHHHRNHHHLSGLCRRFAARRHSLLLFNNSLMTTRGSCATSTAAVITVTSCVIVVIVANLSARSLEAATPV
jgi:hypothetical protein